MIPSSQPNHILVTGGCEFIGAELVSRLERSTNGLTHRHPFFPHRVGGVLYAVLFGPVVGALRAAIFGSVGGALCAATHPVAAQLA